MISAELAGAEPHRIVRNDVTLYFSISGEFWKNMRIGGATTMTVIEKRSIASRNEVGSNRGSITIGAPNSSNIAIESRNVEFKHDGGNVLPA